MRRRHFTAFAPHCPVCARDRGSINRLVLAEVYAEADDDVRAGMLHCPDPICRHEYPIIDGIPLILPRLREHLAERGVELLLRDDLDPRIGSAIGDALGPETWLDAIRQNVSTYGWDSYADLDPAETEGIARSGAARRCLARLWELAPQAGARRIIDVGCAAGRTSFDLAGLAPESLVLGIDTNLALLRLAQSMLAGGEAQYDRRRIGLVYDRRHICADLAGGTRVDFWAADALALPFPREIFDLVVALNVLDCVADPRQLLAGLVDAVRPGGGIMLATPFDWSSRATPVETWVGGHSQRGPYGGAGEPFLRDLLTPGAHRHSVSDIDIIATADWPWQTRLHDRASINYRVQMIALAKRGAFTER